MTARLERLRQLLGELSVDAMLVSSPENRRYLSGFTGSAGYLLISKDDAVLATDFRYVEQAGRQAPAFRVERIAGDTDWLPNVAVSMKLKRIGFEATSVTFSQHAALAEVLEGISAGERPELVPTKGLLVALRAIKDSIEMEATQRAIDIGDAAFEKVSATLQPGMTERYVAWELERSMRELGAESTSFDIIIASGPNSALPHHRPSDRELRATEPIVIDMGARYQGYCSDLTRTLCLGPVDDTFREVYSTVLRAQQYAMAEVTDGMQANAADGLARTVIEEAGYGDKFGHGLGHGVGLAIHEFPSVGQRSSDVLTEGMVFTIEPGIYISGWGGVRIEDIVILENGKARCLSHARKQAVDAA
ncbi:MAG: Xaa-Pro aminopeptidase [Chloroflexi bacterium]|jgi:Xaa-Pro aminopeptidase|nr:MAG: Xaa-Pro aminopeptidase [Chloroflexota bacterium]